MQLLPSAFKKIVCDDAIWTTISKLACSVCCGYRHHWIWWSTVQFSVNGCLLCKQSPCVFGLDKSLILDHRQKTFKLLLKFFTRSVTCIVSYCSIQSVQQFSVLCVSFSHCTWGTILLIVYYIEYSELDSFVVHLCISSLQAIAVIILNLNARNSSFIITR